jgi:hypothetical protein
MVSPVEPIRARTVAKMRQKPEREQARRQRDTQARAMIAGDAQPGSDREQDTGTRRGSP